MVGSKFNRTRENKRKKRGETGAFSLRFVVVVVVFWFFFLVNFSPAPALLPKRLEQPGNIH